jgi:hypothetical protein
MLISFIRNEPVPDGAQTPSTLATVSGVVRKNVLVTKKMTTHNILPQKPTLGEKLPASIANAAVISNTPIIADVVVILKIWYIQLMSGLFFINPAMSLLSVGVNLNAPIHNRIIAIPKLDTMKATFFSSSHLANFNSFILQFILMINYLPFASLVVSSGNSLQSVTLFFKGSFLGVLN